MVLFEERIIYMFNRNIISIFVAINQEQHPQRLVSSGKDCLGFLWCHFTLQPHSGGVQAANIS